MGQGISIKNFAGCEYRLLLVGMTGSGKSSLGNCIIGKKTFQPAVGMRSGTQHCDLKTATRDQINFKVLDTPGFRDSKRTDEENARLIAQMIIGMAPGPNAVLMVIKASERVTPDLNLAYKEVKKILDAKELANRIVLVFTGGDILKKNGIDIHDQLVEMRVELGEMMEDAEDRWVLFNNEAKGKESQTQLVELLRKVNEACLHVPPARRGSRPEAVEAAGACAPDLTFLTSNLQQEIEKIISNEQVEKPNVNAANAADRMREALMIDDGKDERLRRAIKLVLDALTEHGANFDDNRCIVM